MKRVILIAIIVFVAALIAGGSLIPLLGGARGLDIDGVATPHGAATPGAGRGWAHYGGDSGGARFSALHDITPANVRSLEIAWTYETGDAQRPPAVQEQAAAEATPILVDGRLVFCTPFNEVIALHPASGKELWRHDAKIALDQRPANQFVCRGVAFWRDAGAEDACAARLFMGTNDGRLVSLDDATGVPCGDFGRNGEVALDPETDVVWPGEFQITSPPVVVGDTVIVGSSSSDNVRVAAPSGVVRAYDARTGAPKWNFDPAPGLRQANVWAPIAVDEKRGLVFLPTSR